MRQVGFALLLAGAVATGLSCGGAKPRIGTAREMQRDAAPPAKKPPQNPVRWLLGGTPLSWDGAVEAGGGTLYTSAVGERALVPRGALPSAVTLSQFYAPGAPAHVGDRFGFVRPSGAVSVTTTPLGPPVMEYAAPQPHGVASAAGRRALVTVASSGSILRSTDLGRTWKPAAKNVVGVPVDIVMNQQGHGLLLTNPQALWVTTDDGATWKQATGPGGAVVRLAVGDGGSLWAGGAPRRGWYRLVGDRLQKEAMRAIAGPAVSLVQYLARDRVVLARLGGHGTVTAAILPLGSRQAPGWQKLEAPGRCSELRVAAFADTSYVGCLRGRRHHFHLTLWSSMGGAQFHQEVADLDVSTRWAARLVAGPGGWLMVAGRVRKKTGDKPVRITKPDLDQDWNALEIGDVLHLVYPEAGDLYYARVTRDKPIPAPVRLGTQGIVSATLADIGGQPRVLADNLGYLALDPSDPGAPPEKISDRVPRGTKELLRHGKRGIAVHASGQVYETADGGLNWTKLDDAPPFPKGDPNAALTDHCNEHGCQIGHRIRLGWRLGAAAPPLKPVSPSAPLPPRSELPIGRLACKVMGPMEPVGRKVDNSSLADSYSIGGAVRWLTWDDDGTAHLVGRLRDGTKLDERLLSPRSKDVEAIRYMRSRVTPEAVIVARETETEIDNPKKPRVSVELGSYELASRAVRRSRLGTVGRFMDGAVVSPQIGWVDGQAWYRPSGSGAPAFVVDAGGQIRRQALPRLNQDSRDIVGSATRPVVWDGDSAEAGTYADRPGRSLADSTGSVEWSPGGPTRLGTWKGAPAIGVDVITAKSKEPVTAAYAVLLRVKPDPLVVGRVTADSLGDVFDRACEPGASGGVVAWLRNVSEVSIGGFDEPLQRNPLPAHILVRFRPGRKPCVSGWASSIPYNKQFVYVPADALGASYVFASDYGDLRVAPMSCTRAAGG